MSEAALRQRLWLEGFSSLRYCRPFSQEGKRFRQILERRLCLSPKKEQQPANREIRPRPWNSSSITFGKLPSKPTQTRSSSSSWTLIRQTLVPIRHTFCCSKAEFGSFSRNTAGRMSFLFLRSRVKGCVAKREEWNKTLKLRMVNHPVSPFLLCASTPNASPKLNLVFLCNRRTI